MSNGNGNGGQLGAWTRVIEKLGVPVVGLGVFAMVCWVCIAKPFAQNQELIIEERKALLEVLQDSVDTANEANKANKESLATIANATKAMVENSAATKAGIDRLDSEMVEFTGNVREEHATAQESLDAIKQNTEAIKSQTSGGT